MSSLKNKIVIVTGAASGMGKSIAELGSSRQEVGGGVIIPSVGEADDIGQVAVFLGSVESKFLNGSIIVADGGWTAAF